MDLPSQRDRSPLCRRLSLWGRDFNGSSGTVPTKGEALVRGRAGLELTEGGEGRKQALSVPSPPDPGLVSASCPSRP